MGFEDGAKKEVEKVIGVKKSKGFPLGGSGTSLASMESLSMPQVCVVFTFGLGFVEFLGDGLIWLKQVQELVLSADMQCEKCQRRVSDIIAKMNGKLFCYVFRTVPFKREFS